MDIELVGKKLTQEGHVRAPRRGSVRRRELKTGREVNRRAQAGANSWRAAEGVMADRPISKSSK